MKRKKSKIKGFTLVELMVVVVILGLLAMIVGKNVLPYLFRSRISTAKMDIKNIAEAVELYQIENKKLPEDLSELIDPDKPYLKDCTEVPKDPWGNEYQLEEDPDRKGGFIIRSYGPDGEPETEDDITNLNMRTYEEK